MWISGAKPRGACRGDYVLDVETALSIFDLQKSRVQASLEVARWRESSNPVSPRNNRILEKKANPGE